MTAFQQVNGAVVSLEQSVACYVRTGATHAGIPIEETQTTVVGAEDGHIQRIDEFLEGIVHSIGCPAAQDVAEPHHDGGITHVHPSVVPAEDPLGRVEGHTREPLRHFRRRAVRLLPIIDPIIEFGIFDRRF